MGVLESIKGKAVICPVDSPSPAAYINIFEWGDVWVKVKGCDRCSAEGRRKCCTNCKFSLSTGCMVHIENPMSKPFQCVVGPLPDTTFSFCHLEFECVEGSRKGVIRKVCEPIPWKL